MVLCSVDALLPLFSIALQLDLAVFLYTSRSIVFVIGPSLLAHWIIIVVGFNKWMPTSIPHIFIVCWSFNSILCFRLNLVADYPFEMNLLRRPVLVGLILIPLHGRIRNVKVNPDSQHRYWQHFAYVCFSFPSDFMIWHLHHVRWGSALGSFASHWKRIPSGQFCTTMMAQNFALSSPSRRYIPYPSCCAHKLHSESSLAQWWNFISTIAPVFIDIMIILHSCCHGD
jgi:hypothetical protein